MIISSGKLAKQGGKENEVTDRIKIGHGPYIR